MSLSSNQSYEPWANGTYAYRRNPENANFYKNYALDNTKKIEELASKISASELKPWMEKTLSTVRTDFELILDDLNKGKKGRRNQPKVKLIKNYANELANLLNSNIELKDWMRTKLSAAASRMGDVVDGLSATHRNPLFDPKLGQEVAKQIFFKNPEGETRMRSMRRFKRNPNSWSKYLNRRNPQKPVWGDSLFGKAGVWGNTLYRSRRLRRRNPQAPVWGAPTFGKDAAWGKTLFKHRNPQAPVWGAPNFGKEGVWGKTLFRNRNPQAPVWGAPNFGKDAAWGKTLFKRNPDRCPTCFHIDCGCGCDSFSGEDCYCTRNNPQAPVWGAPNFGKDAAWGKTLFRRRNPQAPVWGAPTFGKEAVWGKTLFTRNPDRCPTCSHIDCGCGCDPFSGEDCYCTRSNPQAPVWGAPTFGKEAVWGKTLFRNPDDLEDDMDDWHCDSDWRDNPDEDLFEEDIDFEEGPTYRRN